MNLPTENSEYLDCMSQWAMSMERLFSGVAMSDLEFDLASKELARMECEFRYRLVRLLME